MKKLNFSKDFFKEPNFAEEEILDFWQKNKIFEKLLLKTKNRKPFRFFEGPPYANGRPGIHHILTRIMKDAIIRFWTMKGYYAERKAGWDTHGLPTEIEVEKILGTASKKEIEEKIGLEKFAEEAKKNVFLYKEEWEKLTRRIGFWLDLKNPYITMETNYIESLWWLFKQIHDNGYLFLDEKVLPWCWRCQTSLSSHELAQGYKKIKDNSLYIKFPILKSGDYFLAWTTTPWTLPANAALAINPSAVYLTIKLGEERLILAEDQIKIISEPFEIISRQKGEKLLGIDYKSLYYQKESLNNANNYKVYPAEFVKTSEGTGVVHIAPAFGEDDAELGKKYNLSSFKPLKEDGRFETTDKPWQQKYFQEANELIIKDLENRVLLFKKEAFEHDYPFCWRCGKPLIYYAKKAWFLKTTSVKKEMLKANESINWHPEFIKNGRFGEWLRENVDWVISRERYWGTPLPIWECKECKNFLVIGSIEELNEQRLTTSKPAIFYLMRHCEAENNVKGLPGSYTKEIEEKHGLTEKGERQARNAAKKLAKEKIDVIFASPMKRTRQTAAIVAESLGLPFKIVEELHEINIGVYQQKKLEAFNADYPSDRYLKEAPPEGESLRQARARMVSAVKKLNEEYSGKKILLISHGDPLWALYATLNGVPEKNYNQSWYPKNGEVKKITFPNYPFNGEGELDLHRPFIDEIKLKCPDCGEAARRVKEVADVWFDSGAMPFAQWHYPFENKEKIEKKEHYPADFICEGIDQTRGWFYTLLAIASLAGFEAPYKNVLVNGFVVDENWKKMSKSKGNVVEPFALIEKYGVEAVRWYFYTINQPWEEKKFKEGDVKNSRQFLTILWNTLVFYKTYGAKKSPAILKPKKIINRWLLAKLNETINLSSEAFENYDLISAARKLENFVVEDFSRWHIRRIREIMKTGDKKERGETEAILGQTLLSLAKILSPLLPFLSERIYQELDAKKQSVHFEDWPERKKISTTEKNIIEEMEKTRKIVSMALEERMKAGLKVRQPLGLMKIKKSLDKEFLNLVSNEVNVKKIEVDQKIKNDIEMDFTITHELKEEGAIRDLIRGIQSIRKQKNLKPSQKIKLSVECCEDAELLIKKFEKTLKKEIGIKEINFGKIEQPDCQPVIGEFAFSLKIEL